MGYCTHRNSGPLCWESRAIESSNSWALRMSENSFVGFFCCQKFFPTYSVCFPCTSYYEKVMCVISSESDFCLWFGEFCLTLIWPSHFTALYTNWQNKHLAGHVSACQFKLVHVLWLEEDLCWIVPQVLLTTWSVKGLNWCLLNHSTFCNQDSFGIIRCDLALLDASAALYKSAFLAMIHLHTIPSTATNSFVHQKTEDRQKFVMGWKSLYDFDLTLAVTLPLEGNSQYMERNTPEMYQHTNWR